MKGDIVVLKKLIEGLKRLIGRKRVPVTVPVFVPLSRRRT
jgi:hypothetical protein